MNQIPYDPHGFSRKTYTKKGSRTVITREIKMLVDWVMIWLAVCADEYKLPPMVVYKRRSDKQIMRETQQYSKDAI